jgi:Arabinose efflux permease
MTSRPKIGIIYLTSLLDYLSFATIIPLLPIIFLNSDMLNGYSDDARYFLLGALYAIYPLAQILSNPILGAFSDRVSRKAIFITSYLGDGVGYLLFAFGVFNQQIGLMFLGFFIAGLTGCNVAMSNAYIADNSAGEQKIRRFIFLNILMGLAFILGPLISMYTTAYLYCFLGCACITFFNAGILAISLDNTPTFKSTEIPSIKNLYTDFKSLYLENQNLVRLVVTLFLLFFGWYFFIKFFQVFLIISRSFEESEIFYTLSYCGLCTIVTQILFSFMVKKTMYKPILIRIFITFLALSIVSLAFVSSYFQLSLIIPLFSAAYSLLCPSLVYLMSEEGGRASQGKIMGLYQSVQGLAKVLAPLLMGLTMQVWWKLPLFLSCFFILASAFTFRTKAKKRRLRKPETPYGSSLTN